MGTSRFARNASRVMQSDLYDLAEKINRGTRPRCEAGQDRGVLAKRNKKTLIAKLDPIVRSRSYERSVVGEGG